MDTMTDPSFRRLGLFNKLALMTYEAVREIQPGFTIIGFPSAQSFPGFVSKLGWKKAFNWKYMFCYRFMFKVHTLWLGKPSFTFRELNVIAEELVTYLSKQSLESRIQKYLDAEILKWKAVDNQHKAVRVAGIYEAERLIGYCAYYIDTPKSCQILRVDIVPERRNLVMRHLMNYLFEVTNVNCIYLWDPLRGARRKSLARLGFRFNRFAWGPFHHLFPFIVFTDASASSGNWLDSGSYQFEGIMLD